MWWPVVEQLQREPPKDLDAEKAVIGACLMDPAALDTAFAVLNDADFYGGAHRVVFRACWTLNNKNQPVDLMTVQGMLQDQGLLDSVGGPVALAGFSESVAAATNVGFYCERVAQKSKLRRLIQVSQAITADAYAFQDEPDLVIDRAATAIIDASDNLSSSKAVTMSDVLVKAIAQIEAAGKRPGGIEISTGLDALDRMTLGMHHSELSIVAGRPGSGKSTLLLNLATELAIGQDLPVAFFSLEMQPESLMLRMLSSVGLVDFGRLRSGWLHPNERQQMSRTAQAMSSAPFFMHGPGLNELPQLVASIRRLVRQRKIKAAFIDYLQLIETGPGRFDNRVAEVTFITKRLHQLTLEAKIPILVAAQLNREASKTTGSAPEREPRISDLRESGSIEQDADNVFLLHRPGLSNPSEQEGPAGGHMRLIVGKQRYGPTGAIDLIYQGNFCRVAEHANAPEGQFHA